MTEILFRGKRTYNDKWVEGSLVVTPQGDAYIISTAETKRDVNVLINQCSLNVDPKTIGQFTGLTDKNGVRIFEGDIVRLIDEHNEIEWTAVVVFGNPNSEYNWGWQLKAIGEFDGNKDILLWVDMEESGAYCEIIGNIHDDPELLR